MSHGPSAGAGSVIKAAHGHHDEPHVPVFTGANKAKLDEIVSRYPTKQAALLPALWILQEARGWVSEGGIVEIAEQLGITPAYIRGVVSFYTMYNQHPVGKYLVQVCTTSPCHVCGAEDVVKAFLDQTGCGELGLTSDDGKYTVIEVECLGACGFATPVMVNSDFLESITPANVADVLKRYQ